MELKYQNKSTQWLEKELWRLFSLWVRQSETDDNGIGRCVTCGAFRHWRYMDAGHWISRRHLVTKFHEHNVHPQCKICNGQNNGEPEKMRDYIESKYGTGETSHLEALSKLTAHFGRYEYIRNIEVYTEKLKANNYQIK